MRLLLFFLVFVLPLGAVGSLDDFQKWKGDEPAVSFVELKRVVERFAQMKKQRLLRADRWLGGTAPFSREFFSLEEESEFFPYGQKALLPRRARVLFFGDLHGCAKSLVRSLTALKEKNLIDAEYRIQDPRLFIVFLGDLVDRGKDGAEVLYMVLRLQCENPKQAFLLRGNHEDIAINKNDTFLKELDEKYSKVKRGQVHDLLRVWDFLPAVLFLGVESEDKSLNVIQCCHGGHELGYNPLGFLESKHGISYDAIETIDRLTEAKKLPEPLKEGLKKLPNGEIANFRPDEPTDPVNIGFLWADFAATDDADPVVGFTPGRGWIYGKDLHAHLLERTSTDRVRIKAVFRGHQHYGPMLQQLIAHKGHAVTFQNTVRTFLGATEFLPDYPQMYPTVDSMSLLQTETDFAKWKLTVYSHQAQVQ